MRLFEIARSEVDERFLNTFNNAIAFILDINDYITSIYVCVEILNILRYKINNIQSILNKLMLFIIELKNVHKGEENKICLKYWKKMIFSTSAILRSLSLFSSNRIILNKETWTFSEMISKNNKFFYKKIIKSYIKMIIEKFVNVFKKFVKRNK